MKFNELCKVLCSTKLDIVIFNKRNKYIDSFQVNYLAKGDSDNIMRKIDLMDINPKVSNVKVNSCTGVLTVSVIV